jgi:hypothetical protein
MNAFTFGHSFAAQALNVQDATVGLEGKDPSSEAGEAGAKACGTSVRCVNVQRREHRLPSRPHLPSG